MANKTVCNVFNIHNDEHYEATCEMGTSLNCFFLMGVGCRHLCDDDLPRVKRCIDISLGHEVEKTNFITYDGAEPLFWTLFVATSVYALVGFMILNHPKLKAHPYTLYASEMLIGACANYIIFATYFLMNY